MSKRTYAVARLTRKGQVTIPRKLREELGLKPGDYLVLRPVAGGIFVSKAAIVPESRAEEVLRQVAARIGREAERRGLRDEDLDAFVDEIQTSLYEERYGR